MSALTYLEMIVIGLLQGVSELFPVSSLGHSVLVPALLGGRWARDLNMAESGGAYLDALVAMHVATAIGLVVFFWQDWVRIVTALYESIRHFRVRGRDERLAWLLVIGTIPVGIAGVILDRVVREFLGKPIPAALFLILNGAVLFGVERMLSNKRTDAEFIAALRGESVDSPEETSLIPIVSASEITGEIPVFDSEDEESDARLSALSIPAALAIGACQIFALLPGVSRSGSTIVGGMLYGLKRAEAARFAFLLATPVIAAAGLLKIPDLFRAEVRSSLGPVVVGSVIAGIGAYLSVRFLTKYFETRTLTPFGIYCLIAGFFSLVFLVFVR